jgi:hypothetical protein
VINVKVLRRVINAKIVKNSIARRADGSAGATVSLSSDFHLVNCLPPPMNEKVKTLSEKIKEIHIAATQAKTRQEFFACWTAEDVRDDDIMATEFLLAVVWDLHEKLIQASEVIKILTK